MTTPGPNPPTPPAPRPPAERQPSREEKENATRPPPPAGPRPALPPKGQPWTPPEWVPLPDGWHDDKRVSHRPDCDCPSCLKGTTRPGPDYDPPHLRASKTEVSRETVGGKTHIYWSDGTVTWEQA